MAFLDHIDPGNAGGSVPIPEPVRYFRKRKRPKHHLCPYCELTFTSANDMDRHRVEAHPTRRPMLVAFGEVCRREELVITEPLADGEIQFTDVDAITIDGCSYDSTGAEKYLKEQRSGFFDVRMRHQSYEVVHKLHFRIVDSDVLREVDDCFYETFSTKLALTDQLSEFHRKVEGLPEAGRYYGGGLGSYITGLIIKEGLHHSVSNAIGYLDKLGEAEDKLASYSRVLPQSVLAIIHFIRNDFRPHLGDRYLPALDRARSVFRTGLFKPTNSESMEGNAELPIDNVTETLIASSLLLPQGEERLLRPVSELFQAKSVPQDDQHKAAFLLWLNARHFGVPSTRNDLAKTLKYSPSFKSILTELESNE